jgi:hypothetical protein
METALAHHVSLRGQVGRFVLHYFEMWTRSRFPKEAGLLPVRGRVSSF